MPSCAKLCWDIGSAESFWFWSTLFGSFLDIWRITSSKMSTLINHTSQHTWTTHFSRKYNKNSFSTTCLQNERLRDRFLSFNLDRLLVRVSSETKFRQEGRTEFKTGDRPQTGFQAGQSFAWTFFPVFKSCHRSCILPENPVLPYCPKFRLVKLCLTTCLFFELKTCFLLTDCRD